MPAAVRLRDFIEDEDSWFYAVSTYDNTERVGCVLRYIPDPDGDRRRPTGERYRKLEFEEAYDLVRRTKPGYADTVQRVPHDDIVKVWKPEEEIGAICERNGRVQTLVWLLDLPPGSIGCTGSFLCGFENEQSDIDLVVYGSTWFVAQERLRRMIEEGTIQDLSPEMWWKVYRKRQPAIPFNLFVLHERRKWNRGEIQGTYFDLLYTRSYDALESVPTKRGKVLGRTRIQARVKDASLSFDNPAIYEVEHEEITRVLSFTHTYAGQARQGEMIEAQGVCEEHGEERWLVVGTSRIAPNEYILSLSLMGR